MPSYEEEISKLIEKVLNAIEMGKLKIGDKVYCTRILRYVTIVEFPKRERIKEYQKKMKVDKNTPFIGGTLNLKGEKKVI